jgi:NAD(P)-dependent dehydrogenase (short-subunit alcohol dehydrogenase family)
MDTKRTAIVTGGNRGIGYDICRQLGEQGYTVLMGSRDAANGAEAAAALRDGGADVTALTLDVSQRGSIEQAVTTVWERFGRIDVLVNNAGIFLDRYSGLDVTPDTVRQTLEVNVLGPLQLMQAVIPYMQQGGYGRIVNVSSMMGQLSGMGSGSLAYRTSKSALNALTRVLAAEVRDSNILINAASPGWVRSDMGGPSASRTLAEGADTPVWLATLPDSGPTGGFFHDRQQVAW